MKTIESTALTFVATDLTGSEAHGLQWRTLRTATRVSSGSHPGLPAGSVVTAAGYGFAETQRRPDTAVRRVVVLADLSEMPPQESNGVAVAPTLGQRQFPKVFVSGAYVCKNCPSPAPSGGLELAIVHDCAYVVVDPSAWASVADPVLLTIALCWRLSALVEQLDQLADWSRNACSLPGESLFRGPQRRDELGVRLRALRRLVLDLPCFEGPLIDPRGYFGSVRPARLFQALVKRLGLDSWRALIDERVEIVEAVLESLAEERRHHAALTCEIVLEVLILIALLADIAINVFAVSAGAS